MKPAKDKSELAVFSVCTNKCECCKILKEKETEREKKLAQANGIISKIQDVLCKDGRGGDMICQCCDPIREILKDKR